MRVLSSAAAAAAFVVFAAAPALAGPMGCGSRAPAIVAHEATTPVAKRAPVVSEVIVTPGVATVAGIRPAPVAPPALYVIEGETVRSGS